MTNCAYSLFPREDGQTASLVNVQEDEIPVFQVPE